MRVGQVATLAALMMAMGVKVRGFFEWGSPECVDLLIKAGADVNLKDEDEVWRSTMNTCSHDL